MEIELKLEVAGADAEALLGGALFEVAGTETLTSIYFDTGARHLRAAGFSLRVRHAGKRRIQTIKADAPAATGLFVRGEWEQEITGDAPMLDAPDLPLRGHVADEVLTAVGPSFRTQVERATAIAHVGGGTIEVVLDRGEIVASDRSAALCELELELREGPATALFELARRIDATVPVRIGVLSKSDRGYRLAEDGVRPAEKARPIALSADMTAATAFQAIAAACIRQFRLNEMLLGQSEDASALHQARVGLRRLRSALSLFKPMLADDRFEQLRAGLKWIAGVLGEARNIDVLVARFTDAPRLARLQEGREQAYRDVAAALASTRLRHLMLDLTEWLALGDWLSAVDGAALRDRPILQAAASILDRHRKRVKRSGADLVELDDESRHEARIETKKLRYAAEFFAALYASDKEVRRAKLFRDALDELQEQLGELNDLATMPSVLRQLGIGEAAAQDGPAGQTDRKKILKKAGKAYGALVDAKRFWH